VDIHKINHVGIAGAGAWGTALAQLAVAAKCKVTLWAHREALVSEINEQHVNSRFLPGRSLSEGVVATSDPGALAAADAILLVCPAQRLRQTLRLMPVRVPVAICAKGIEKGSGLLMHEVCMQEVPGGKFGMLSGPSFADDVVRGLPCAVTIAFEDQVIASLLGEALGSGTFRPYASGDVVGVAVGGAVKNVLAIACGIVDGRGLGESARAAIMTRGFAEMARFGLALGAKLETLSGLSGFGDLVLTASSRQSRNFSLGIALGQGGSVHRAGPLAEGAATAPALVRRAQELGIQMPIAEAVADIVEGRIDVDAAIRALLSRPLKSEH
jgi:glycerol-3-phosphate dehydrogenase (NAD(P)+)